MRFSDELLFNISGIRKTFPSFDLKLRGNVLKNHRFIYDCIVGSENLCFLAMQKTEDSSRFLSGLKKFFRSHLQEERNHAEWLLEDLQGAGLTVDAFVRNPHAVRLVGEQYYRVLHIHPVCLLGYMAALECFPMDPSQLEMLEELHGKELFRTLRHHVEEDPGHSGEIKLVLNSVPEGYHAIVKESALATTLILRSAFAEFGERRG